LQLHSVIIREFQNSVFDPVYCCIVAGCTNETVSLDGRVGEVFENVGFGEEIGAQKDTAKFVLERLGREERGKRKRTDSTRGLEPGVGSVVGALDPVAARARRERSGVKSLILKEVTCKKQRHNTI
jgi:hypothetical protein